MAKELIFAVFTIPIFLLLALTVFQHFFTSTQSVFEQTITNESLGTGAGTYYTAYPAKVGSAIVYNGTKICSGCTVDYRDGLEVAEVIAGEGETGEIKISYTAYAKEGYTGFTKTYTGTQSGFNLASMLPFILIAVVIVGVIIGALALR